MTETRETARAAEAKRAERLAESHLRLLGNPDFQRHLDWLADELLAQRDQNDLIEGVALYRGQGEAIQIRKIIDRVDASGTIKARIRAAEGKRIRKTTMSGAD